MTFLESIFNAFISRDQRERIFRSNWEKSVAQAALELRLEQEKLDALPPTSPSPSLSSSSSHTAASSSGCSSPSRSRPPTSYSASPRPEFRRHKSIPREPISYDYLMSSCAEESSKSPRLASHEQDPPPQMLYPLPPLDPMEGIGRFRRSVYASDEFVENLQRSIIAAPRPFVSHDARVSPNCRRDTTSLPSTNSVSPPLDQRLAMQSRLASKLSVKTELDREWRSRQLAHLQAQPLIEDCPPVAAAESPQQLTSPEMVRLKSRPIRVATKRRAYNSSERNHNSNKATKRTSQAVGGMNRGVKTGKNSGSAAGRYKRRQRLEVELSSSMVTLVSGEE